MAERSAAPQLLLETDGDAQLINPDRSYHLGRDPDSDVVLGDPRVSWHHAVLHTAPDGHWMLDDEDSTNGTYVDGHRVQHLDLGPGTLLRFGDAVDGAWAQLAELPEPTTVNRRPSALTVLTGSYRQPTRIAPLPQRLLRIGRGADNDLVVDDLVVSRHHAELLADRTSGTYEIVDLGSHNGTFVNGQAVDRAPVGPTDVIGIGHSLFCLVGDELQEYVDTGAVGLDVADLTVRVGGGRTLLDGVTFPVAEKCLLAVAGPSGAGKSTLLNALTGLRPAEEGSVRYDGRDLYRDYAELRQRIGLVPQDDILHTQLTVRRALGYAAELRFPGDTSKAERRARVTEVIGELGLEQRADQVISSLSGGQRKRVSVALELLTKPSLLFLDEPTSGLDPGMDRSVMHMLRRLADDGRTVVVVTHSVLSLDVCDRLLLLAPGGRIAFYGPPGEALPFFGFPSWPDAFEAFEDDRSRDWAGEFRGSEPHHRYITQAMARPDRAAVAGLRTAGAVGAGLVDGPGAGWGTGGGPSAGVRAGNGAGNGAYPAAGAGGRGAGPGFAGPAGAGAVGAGLAGAEADIAPPPPPAQSWGAQLRTLVRRYAAALAADRTFLVIMIALPFVMGAMAHALAGSRLDQNSALNALLILCVGGVLTGAANAVRELVKERTIYQRERAVGLSRSAYLCSKIVVLGTITVVQAVVLTMVGLFGVRLRPRGGHGVLTVPLLEITLTVALLSFTAMMLGLLVSALVRKEEVTMPLLVLLAIVQVVFCGALLKLNGVPVLDQLSWLVPSRWALGAMAGTIDLHSVVPGTLTADPLFAHRASTWLLDLGMLVVLSAVLAFLVARLLRRHEPVVMRG